MVVWSPESGLYSLGFRFIGGAETVRLPKYGSLGGSGHRPQTLNPYQQQQGLGNSICCTQRDWRGWELPPRSL